MKLELQSDRLALTPLVPADLDLCLEMFTDPEVVEYFCDLMNETEIREGMTNWIKRGGNGCIGIWCISDLEKREKYGTVALLPMPIDEDDTDYSLVMPGMMPESPIEIGYSLKRSDWGNGYATEACARLLQFVFKETSLNEVVATLDEENISSRNVLEKVGFTHRGSLWCYGEDSPIYRIRRDEWFRLRHAG